MRLVDTQRGLEEAASSLASTAALYIDTEFEARREGTELCLIQISDGKSLFLIDALRFTSLGALRPVLADAGRPWVVHAGSQDVPLLVDRLGLEAPPRVFDTQVAWALTTAEYSVSLAYLKFRILGQRTGKPHQADDWKRRPLPAAQLAYAAADIEDLPALHEALRRRLEERDRSEIVFEASCELTSPTRSEPDALSLDSFRNAWQLDRDSQAALRFLVDWYNGLSPSQRGSAPEAKTLLAIASRLPETRDDLGRIKGVPRRWVNEKGDWFTGELMRATATADANSFVPIDPPPYATFEEIRWDAWLTTARAEICIELELAPELAFPGRVLKRMRSLIGAAGDRSAALGALEGWRAELLAEPFRRFLARAG